MTKYTITESFMGFVVATTSQELGSIESAMIFSHNNRRSMRTMIEISSNGKALARQESIGEDWAIVGKF